MMRVVVIMNPVAGASGQRSRVRALLNRLEKCGIHVDWQFTDAAGHAHRIAAQAGHDSDAVIVVGGDGTVREVADGLMGTDVPLVIWPTGTGNLVAKSLGFRPDPDVVLACLKNKSILSMDVGVANDRSFLVVAGIGFDAEVVCRLTRLRKGHITHFAYVGPIWRTFWEHRFPAIRVINDGQLYWEGRGLVFVGNLARYALGLPVVRDARPDDGRLDLCVLPCHGRAGLLGHSLRTMLRTHVEHRSARYTQVRSIRIEAVPSTEEKGSGSFCAQHPAGRSGKRYLTPFLRPFRGGPMPFELDGDDAGCLPLDIHIRPAALRVLLPPVPRHHAAAVFHRGGQSHGES